jgi:hypothetical protein
MRAVGHNVRLLTANVCCPQERANTFCPLIMTAGRPQQAKPGELYAFAHLFYWDFRRIAEGFARQKLDGIEYKRLSSEANKIELQLTPEKLAVLEAKAVEEIRNGRLTESERFEWIRSAEDSWLTAIREDLRQRAAENATKQLKVPGEPEIIQQLMEAETANEVREICEDAFAQVNCKIAPDTYRELTLPNWPIPVGSVLPSNLSQYASEFIAARKDPRFPRSTSRPTSRLKQLWFLSRALAGALYGVKTRTAINLIGSKRPEELFEESNSARPVRKGTKVRQARQKSVR